MDLAGRYGTFVTAVQAAVSVKVHTNCLTRGYKPQGQPSYGAVEKNICVRNDFGVA